MVVEKFAFKKMRHNPHMRHNTRILPYPRDETMMMSQLFTTEQDEPERTTPSYVGEHRFYW